HLKLRSERVAEVAENIQCPVGIANDDLMQINVVGKSRERLPHFGSGTNFQRRTEMEFADLDLVLLEQRDGLLRLLKFDGQMTGVVVHAQMFIETGIVMVFGAQPVEEVNSFAAG